jgi:hypothetical protein
MSRTTNLTVISHPLGERLDRARRLARVRYGARQPAGA